MTELPRAYLREVEGGGGEGGEGEGLMDLQLNNGRKP